MIVFKKIFEFELFNIGDFHVKVYSLVFILLIILVAKLLLYIIKRTLYRNKNLQHHDRGSVYAIFQIIKYLVWLAAIAFILESVGVKLTVLIAGSAALLVGVGLGLQQTFNDVVSGIILLSERSIRVDDILEIDGEVVKIEEIGFRTSTGSNTDNISIIIPNSLITTNKVINWSHQSKRTRFRINVGVSYGSDVDLVISLLEESANEHIDVEEKELTEVRLISFGDSSLDFELLFFSKKIFRIGKMKSDIRININNKFAKNNIVIPFPQMDLHVNKQDHK
ncbi:MAG: mechanosensitive ion channel domain-containing protein [Marinifilaceae bacterium]